MIMTVKRAPLMSLNYEARRDGITIPPEAFVVMPKSILVTYGEGDEVVGSAFLKRVGNQILADISLNVTALNTKEAEKAIRKLYPAVSFTIQEAEAGSVFKLKIYEVFLTPYSPADTSVEQIDNYLIIGAALDN